MHIILRVTFQAIAGHIFFTASQYVATSAIMFKTRYRHEEMHLILTKNIFAVGERTVTVHIAGAGATRHDTERVMLKTPQQEQF